MKDPINDTHHKYPRTLQEAFGPYTDNRLDTHGPPKRIEPFIREVQDWALIVCAGLVIFVLIATT